MRTGTIVGRMLHLLKCPPNWLRLGLSSVCLLGLCAQLYAEQINSLEELIAKHIEANGGQEHIDNIRSLRATSRIDSDQVVTKITMIKKRPSSQRVVFKTGKITVTKGIFEGIAWQKLEGPGGEIAKWMEREEAIDFYDSSHFDSYLLRKQRPGYKMEFLGRTRFNEEEAYEVAVESINSGNFSIFVDPEELYETGIRTHKQVGLVDVAIDTIYKKNKKIDGVWVAMQIETYEDNVLMTSLEIEDLEFNVGAPNFYFRAPSELTQKEPKPPYEIDYYIDEEAEERREETERRKQASSLKPSDS